jgi:CubicO group peptidase (beta-lactamase class C family)
MSKIQSSTISGFVKPRFEAVRAAFVENFTRRNELGAACCIYYQGEKVVDLWGGIRNKATGDHWEEDTMVLVFSATKGLSALAMALAQSRGLFDYDECVCTYWPEFAGQSKEKITIRQLLSHQAALFAFDVPMNKRVVADLDRLAAVMAQQKPAWEPGTRQAYHAISLGFCEGELLRRVDPRHRSLGQFFQEEIASPLGLDFYIRLPEEIPNSRLATLQMANYALAIFHNPLPLTFAAMNRRSPLYRAMVSNPGTLLPLDPDRVYARNLEVPSGGGVGTARAIAHAYSEFATGGHVLGVREDTLQQLMAPAVAPLHGFYDECLKVEVPFSLGFSKPSSAHPSPFGAPGAGGSMGFADPQAEIGYGYVLNRMGTYMEDPRDLALRTAMYQSIGETPSFHARGLEESVSRSTTREH